MKKLLLISVLLLVCVNVAYASFNPLDWVKNGIGSVLEGGAWGLFGLVIMWLGKGKWDAIQLKRAMTDIKLAVDEVRKANDANSPGGDKVTVGEMTGIAEKSLTSILSVLRGMNPKWIPHWLG